MTPFSAAGKQPFARELLLASWETSPSVSRRVAAAWGLELLSQPSGRQAESSAAIAARFGTTPATAERARRLLMGTGIIRRQAENRRYYVT